jgi:hypothetical protein
VETGIGADGIVVVEDFAAFAAFVLVGLCYAHFGLLARVSKMGWGFWIMAEVDGYWSSWP